MVRRRTPAPTVPAPDLSYIHPALRGFAVPLTSLSLDPDNARAHDERNIRAIMESLKAHGQIQLVVAQPSGRVRAGNGRMIAAHRLGWTHLAVLTTDHDDLEAVIYALRDNRTAELASWAPEGLAGSLAALQAASVPIESVGWLPSEFGPLLKTEWEPATEVTTAAEAETPTVADPELPVVSELGEVYELGAHRLLCGDSTQPGAVAGLLGDVTPQLWIYDPPYDVPFGTWPLLPSVQVAAIWHRGKDAYLWMADTFRDKAWSGAFEMIFPGHLRGQANPTIPCCVHDSVTIFRRKWWAAGKHHLAIDKATIAAAGVKMTTDGRPMTVQEARSNLASTMPYAKSVTQFAVMMAFCARGAGVWDSCAGGGGSLLAAAQHGRVWRGAEIDPASCDLIRRRWTKWAAAAGVDPGTGALDLPNTPRAGRSGRRGTRSAARRAGS